MDTTFLENHFQAEHADELYPSTKSLHFTLHFKIKIFLDIL
jgi:hypothetical protein